MNGHKVGKGNLWPLEHDSGIPAIEFVPILVSVLPISFLFWIRILNSCHTKSLCSILVDIRIKFKMHHFIFQNYNGSGIQNRSRDFDLDPDPTNSNGSKRILNRIILFRYVAFNSLEVR